MKKVIFSLAVFCLLFFVINFSSSVFFSPALAEDEYVGTCIINYTINGVSKLETVKTITHAECNSGAEAFHQSLLDSLEDGGNVTFSHNWIVDHIQPITPVEEGGVEETPPAGITETSGGRKVPGSNVPLVNPITGKHDKPDIAKYIQGVIEVSLGLVGVLALTSFIYGGVLWMISMGNSSLVEKGKKVMIWSVVGLLIVFSSYGIIKVIFELFGYK